ncbi:5843_t:CDS:2 [Funneliformis geosporum]|nr:5843_t:CDS:2 [Funneliformis geosporum]
MSSSTFTTFDVVIQSGPRLWDVTGHCVFVQGPKLFYNIRDAVVVNTPLIVSRASY